MTNAFVEKLRGFGHLDPTDEIRLAAACGQVRTYAADRDLIREGDKPGPVFVILKGWAARYKILPDGSRQIIAFMMPGDFCDMHVAMLGEMDHNIGTLTAVTAATIQRPEMEALIVASTGLARAFWWTQLVDSAELRATIVSMGRRSSLQRVAHLLCELVMRMRNAGLSASAPYVMPFTQIMLADAVGLTPVHVNRVVKRLRLIGGLENGGSTIAVSDVSILARVAGFSSNYLHRRLEQSEPARFAISGV